VKELKYKSSSLHHSGYTDADRSKDCVPLVLLGSVVRGPIFTVCGVGVNYFLMVCGAVLVLQQVPLGWTLEREGKKLICWCCEGLQVYMYNYAPREVRKSILL
jgi:hypothetical protein